MYVFINFCKYYTQKFYEPGQGYYNACFKMINIFHINILQKEKWEMSLHHNLPW